MIEERRKLQNEIGFARSATAAASTLLEFLELGLFCLVLSVAGCDQRGNLPITELGKVASLTPELRIDGRDQQMTSIGRATVRADGVIAIAPLRQGLIHFYSPSGTYIGTAGEGEFSIASRMGWRADTLWVSDLPLQRMLLIAPDIEIDRITEGVGGMAARLHLESDPRDVEVALAIPLALYSDGSMLTYLGGGMESAPEPLRSGRINFGVVSPEMELLRVITQLPPSEGGTVNNPSEGGTIIPFTNSPAWSVSPGGGILAIAMALVSGRAAGTLVVSAWGADGRELLRTNHVLELEPIPHSVKDSVLSRMISALGPMRPGLVAALQRAEIPGFYPPLQGARFPSDALVVGRDSTIWLELRARPEGRPVVALEPRGEVVGTLYLPVDSRIVAAQLDRIWVVEADSAGVDGLARYRISWE